MIQKAESESDKTHHVNPLELKNRLVRFVKKSILGTTLCDFAMRIPVIHDLSARLDSGEFYRNAVAVFRKNAAQLAEIEQLLDATSLVSYRAVQKAMESMRRRALRRGVRPSRFQYFDPELPSSISVSMVSGNIRSSASRKNTISPFAAATHAFRAVDTPPFS